MLAFYVGVRPSSAHFAAAPASDPNFVLIQISDAKGKQCRVRIPLTEGLEMADDLLRQTTTLYPGIKADPPERCWKISSTARNVTMYLDGRTKKYAYDEATVTMKKLYAVEFAQLITFHVNTCLKNLAAQREAA